MGMIKFPVIHDSAKMRVPLSTLLPISHGAGSSTPSQVVLEGGSHYFDPFASAEDNLEGEVTHKITRAIEVTGSSLACLIFPLARETWTCSVCSRQLLLIIQSL